MGTSYTILKKDGLEVTIDEHSNVFDLSVEVTEGENPTDKSPMLIFEREDGVASAYVNRPAITTADLLLMAMNIISVAGYWDIPSNTTQDLAEAMKKCHDEFGVKTMLLTALKQQTAE